MQSNIQSSSQGSMQAASVESNLVVVENVVVARKVICENLFMPAAAESNKAVVPQPIKLPSFYHLIQIGSWYDEIALSLTPLYFGASGIGLGNFYNTSTTTANAIKFQVPYEVTGVYINISFAIIPGTDPGAVLVALYNTAGNLLPTDFNDMTLDTTSEPTIYGKRLECTLTTPLAANEPFLIGLSQVLENLNNAALFVFAVTAKVNIYL